MSMIYIQINKLGNKKNAKNSNKFLNSLYYNKKFKMINLNKFKILVII